MGLEGLDGWCSLANEPLLVDLRRLLLRIGCMVRSPSASNQVFARAWL